MPNYSAKEGPFKVALASGDAIWFIGGYITLLSHARETRGQISLTEWVGPRGMCAPPHSHTLEAEGFYILEGDLTVGVGGQKFECQRGDFLYVPKTAPHEFMVNSATAKFLVTITPAGFEEFFREVSEGPARAATWPSSGGTVPPVERIMEAGEKYKWRPEFEPRSLGVQVSQKIFFSACHAGKRFKLGGGLIVLKATREQTEDRFSVSECFGPRDWKIPSLTYAHQGTTYYGLDGEFRISCPNEPFSLRAGEMVYVPPGVAHSVEVATRFARMVVCATESAIEELTLVGEALIADDELKLDGKIPIDQGKLARIGSDTAAWAIV
jgi:quercetin dioxygenase-like cupin family protein